MTLQQLADQTNPADFQRLYHDPKIHTSEIADRFGIKATRLSEFAHLLGIPTRREAGVCWTPTLLMVKADKPPNLVGWRGCTDCPMLKSCRDDRLWVNGPLPCETLLPFEVDIEYDLDSSPTLWVMPVVVKVNVEAMG